MGSINATYFFLIYTFFIYKLTDIVILMRMTMNPVLFRWKVWYRSDVYPLIISKWLYAIVVYAISGKFRVACAFPEIFLVERQSRDVKSIRITSSTWMRFCVSAAVRGIPFTSLTTGSRRRLTIRDDKACKLLRLLYEIRARKLFRLSQRFFCGCLYSILTRLSEFIDFWQKIKE